MSARTIAVAFAPAGALLAVQVSADRWVQGQTDASGYIAFNGVDDGLGDSVIKIQADGFQPYAEHVKWKNVRDNANEPRPLNHQVNIGFDLPDLTPIAPELDPPRIVSDQFVDAYGQRTLLLIADGFRLAERLFKGENCDPFYGQLQALGFEWIRVFFSYCADDQGRGIGRLVPSELPGFADTISLIVDDINAHGFGCYGTCLADAQRCFRSVGEQQEYWQQFGAGLRGKVALASVGNEHGDWTRNDYSKNGFNPGQFPHLDGLLCSRGAGVQDVPPYLPVMDFCEFRNRRDMPAMLLDSVASPETIRRSGVTVPIVFDECTKYGDGYEADDHLARKLASHYAVEAAGLCYHSVEGIDARIMDATSERCARAWLDGARRQL